VFSDAKSRGKSTVGAFIWSLLTFMLLIVFLPLWLIVRPKKSFGVSVIEKPTLCVNCGKYYEGIPSFCPNCGKAMRDHSST
jgi:hypothetical protein